VLHNNSRDTAAAAAATQDRS